MSSVNFELTVINKRTNVYRIFATNGNSQSTELPESNKLFRKLAKIDGVRLAAHSDIRKIVIEKKAMFDWEEIEPQIKETIRIHFEADEILEKGTICREPEKEFVHRDIDKEENEEKLKWKSLNDDA